MHAIFTPGISVEAKQVVMPEVDREPSSAPVLAARDDRSVRKEDALFSIFPFKPAFPK